MTVFLFVLAFFAATSMFQLMQRECFFLSVSLLWTDQFVSFFFFLSSCRTTRSSQTAWDVLTGSHSAVKILENDKHGCLDQRMRVVIYTTGSVMVDTLRWAACLCCFFTSGFFFFFFFFFGNFRIQDILVHRPHSSDPNTDSSKVKQDDTLVILWGWHTFFPV